MPIIEVQLIEGRSLEVKKILMNEINEVVCRTLDVSPNQVRILINEYPKENWSIGGVSKAEVSSN